MYGLPSLLLKHLWEKIYSPSNKLDGSPGGLIKLAACEEDITKKKETSPEEKTLTKEKSLKKETQTATN